MKLYVPNPSRTQSPKPLNNVKTKGLLIHTIDFYRPLVELQNFDPGRKLNTFLYFSLVSLYLLFGIALQFIPYFTTRTSLTTQKGMFSLASH